MNNAATRVARTVGGSVADFFVPRRCVSCGAAASQWRAPVCVQCQAVLEELKIPGESRHKLRRILSVNEEIDSVFGMYAYIDNPVIRGIVHAMKYRGGQSLCERMGRVIGTEIRLSGEGELFDCLIPVPIHPARRRERRYNQSSLLAKGIASVLRREIVEDVLFRTKKTRPQAFLDSSMRQKNIAGAFAVRKKLVDGLRVGLVDDVVTTGATVNLCAQALKNAGAGSVTVVCVAVAQTEPLLSPVVSELVEIR